jgi:hypothetical protein
MGVQPHWLGLVASPPQVCGALQVVVPQVRTGMPQPGSCVPQVEPAGQSVGVQVAAQLLFEHTWPPEEQLFG